MKRIVALLIVSIVYIGLESFAAEINFDKVVFKNSKGSYFYTENGGETWTKLRLNENKFKNQVFINGNNDVFISDDNGVTWKPESVSSVEASAAPEEASAYPNPSPGSVCVKYEASTAGKALINVFNSVGENVIKNIEHESLAGINQVQLNLSSLNAGVYYATIELGGKVFTARLIVAR